ncbi:MAG: hypothetical protein AAF184_11695 [Pseudomonadota bacterium]
MHDLCLTQALAYYPYSGPYLRIRAVNAMELEFRYIDTPCESEQWARTVPAEQAWGRFLSFLEQLSWFTELGVDRVTPRGDMSES